MRPGPHPWATLDIYAAGPDVGSDTKTEPGTAHQQDGYYRTRRPAPDILNWQLNRDHLTYQFMAKMMASTMTLQRTTASIAGDTLDGSTHVTASAIASNVQCFYFYDAAGNLNEMVLYDGMNNTAPASNPIAAAVGAGMSAIDADADDSAEDRVIVVTGVNDQVYTANGFGGGAWALSALGAPALNWTAVGCDRNTEGGANARFFIGDDAGGGTAILYESTNGGANFAANAAFNALLIAEPIVFIGHTCHPSGAVGYDDVGNESWLVLTTTRAVISGNGGTSWTNNAHGFGVAPSGPKCCAYSRTAARWVFVNTNDTWYSDDNGATWAADANSLPGAVPVNPMQIKSDGYGTFIVADDNDDESYHVSVDDGLTWTHCTHDLANISIAGWDSVELEVSCNSEDDWDHVGDAPTCFSIFYHDTAAPLQGAFTTPRY